MIRAIINQAKSNYRNYIFALLFGTTYIILFYLIFIQNPFKESIFKALFPNSNTLIKNQNLLYLAIFLISSLSVSLIYFFRNYFRFLKARYVFLSIIFCLILFFIFAIYSKYTNFQTFTFDLGIQLQVIWNTANGRLFTSSLETANFLGDHFSPLLIIPALIYKIFPGVLTIFIIQTLCVALGSVGIYLISKKVLKNGFISMVLGILFFIYPSISGILLYDFHEISLAIPFLVFGIYLYLINNKFWIVSFLLALLAKEDVGIFVGSFGIYILLAKKDLKGLLLMLMGYIYSALALLVFIPAFRSEASDTLYRYKDWGSSGVEIAKNIIFNPIKALQYSFQDNKIIYILRMFLPIGFLSIFAPFTILVILPSLFVNLLSSSNAQVSNLFQYDVMITIGVFFSTIMGLNNLFFLMDKYKINRNITLLLLVPLNILIFLFHPVWTVIKTPLFNRQEDLSVILEYRNKISEEKIISATDTVGSLFAERERFQLFYPEFTMHNALPDYIFIDKKVDYYNDSRKKADLYINEKGYKIDYENDGLLVLSNN